MKVILINYSDSGKVYQIYDPETETALISENLTEALVNLGNYLTSIGVMPKGQDLLSVDTITYQIDPATMRAMIEPNVALMKRLHEAPSAFMISSQKFGSSNAPTQSKDPEKGTIKKKLGKSGNVTGRSGFSKSDKKFGLK